MKNPLQLRFVGIEASAAVAACARDKAAKLDEFHPDLTGCHVTIEERDKHRHQGRHFAVRIELAFPGGVLSVDQVQEEDVYVALREAFDAMRRQLQDHVQRKQDSAKIPAGEGIGEVLRTDPLALGKHRVE